MSARILIYLDKLRVLAFHLPINLFKKSAQNWFYGRKGCVAGQGEMKKVGFDPLFSINHTFAMMRANISRLNRRTWNTTKKLSALVDHLSIYAWRHPTSLTSQSNHSISPRHMGCENPEFIEINEDSSDHVTMVLSTCLVMWVALTWCSRPNASLNQDSYAYF